MKTEMEIEARITTLKKRFEDYDPVEYETLLKMTKWDIAEEEENLKDVQLINSFSGRIKKSVIIMKKIHDTWMDENHPDEKDVNKVKALLNRERTDLELKIKKLKEKLSQVDGLEGYTEYDHPSGWWNAVERIFGDS